MVQQVGETRDAIIEDDNKRIESIVAANKNKKDLYWIVLFATPAKMSIDGKPTMMKHIKAYDIKPMSQVGMIIGEVDNKSGVIRWEINMPQKPFNYDALSKFGVEPTNDVVYETTTIAEAYITR